MKSGINIKQIKVNLARLKMRSLVALAHGSDVFSATWCARFFRLLESFCSLFFETIIAEPITIRISRRTPFIIDKLYEVQAGKLKSVGLSISLDELRKLYGV